MMRIQKDRTVFAMLTAALLGFGFALLFGIHASTVFGQEEDVFAGGEGTEENPYLVETPRQLDNVRNHMDAHFRQSADIDLGEYGGEEGWEPIGYHRRWDDYAIFTGTFDGNGHRILNLTIDRPETDYVGLFGYAGEGARLKGLTLENVELSGGRYTGALVGYNPGGRIDDCSGAGRVAGGEETGGLVGANREAIIASHAAVDVTGAGRNTGGLAASNSGTITDSYATGRVAGAEVNVGGLVGVNGGGGEITDSYATGDVVGEAGLAGGLVGSNSGKIMTASAAGTVRGGSYVGGLVGKSERVGRTAFGGEISAADATGDVIGETAVGGLVGDNSGVLTRSYATGDVTGETWVGGLIGDNVRAVNESYAEGAVEGTNEVGGLVGRSSHNAHIRRCYATGSVAGETDVGGLIGHNARGRTIENSYATGAVSGERSVGGLLGRGRIDRGGVTNCYAAGEVTGGRNTGGLVGRFYHRGQSINSYYDKGIAGQDNTERGIPLTTGEMMRRETFEDWDFDDVWRIDEGEGYPYLLWQMEKQDVEPS